MATSLGLASFCTDDQHNTGDAGKSLTFSAILANSANLLDALAGVCKLTIALFPRQAESG